MRAVCSCIGVALVSCIILDARPNTADPAGVLVGGISRHVVQRGESLRSIGARYGVDAATIAEANTLERSARLLAGQALTIDNHHIVPSAVFEGVIVVNVPQRMLFFRHGTELFDAPVAVGSRGWQTPLAPFTIRIKETDPTWDVPASIAAEARARGQRLPARVPPGTTNPLGHHWLGLSIGSVGIHGTNVPASIYGAVTHGCIRVHPDDIAVLFDLVAVGTPGATLYEPVLLAEADGEVYLEVHPDVYRRMSQPPAFVARSIAVARGISERIDWSIADRVARRQSGIAQAVTSR